jgi:hypothetical protein
MVKLLPVINQRNKFDCRGLLAAELRDRNRGDTAASYTGQIPENTLGDQSGKQNENDRIAVSGSTQHT